MIKCEIYNSDNPEEQINDCLRIVDLIDKETDNILSLDMTGIDWLTPFSALILSSKIVQCNNRFKRVSILEPKKSKVGSYMANIGFPMGKKGRGYSYSPINHFTKDANKAANDAFEIVDTQFPDVLKNSAIKYIISEFCDNVEQHSNFTHASIMTQYYRTKNFIDIGIIDNGISIPGAFEKNKIKFNEDVEAIDMAIHGRSTKKEGGRGKGLISTRAIVEQGLKGEFYVVSRGGMVATGHGHDRKLYKFQNLSLKGTLGYIRFEVPKKEVNWQDYLS